MLSIIRWLFRKSFIYRYLSVIIQRIPIHQTFSFSTHDVSVYRIHFIRARARARTRVLLGRIFFRVSQAKERRGQTTGRIQMRWSFSACKPLVDSPSPTILEYTGPLFTVMEEAVREKSLSVHRTFARRASFLRIPSRSYGNHSEVGRGRECHVTIGTR